MQTWLQCKGSFVLCFIVWWMLCRLMYIYTWFTLGKWAMLTALTYLLCISSEEQHRSNDCFVLRRACLKLESNIHNWVSATQWSSFPSEPSICTKYIPSRFPSEKLKFLSCFTPVVLILLFCFLRKETNLWKVFGSLIKCFAWLNANAATYFHPRECKAHAAA